LFKLFLRSSKVIKLCLHLYKPAVTPGFEKVTECIPYVRQDQVPHIQ
jgi:hypothetical protein